MTKLTEHAADMRGMKIALVSSVIVVVLQLVVYFLTNILVMLAAAFDSLSDVLISTFLLLSSLWSRKAADETHMFGHGRAQNVAALVSATIFIFVLSLETFREAIPKLFQAEASEFQNVELALAATAVAVVLYAIPLVDISRAKKRGAAAKAQLVALLEMEVAFVATLIAIVLIAQGYYLMDPLVSMFIGAAVALSGLYLLRDNVEYLIGKAPDREFMELIESTARSVNGVLGVHDLKAEYVGPGIVHTGFHIDVSRGTPIEEADRIAEEVKEKVGQRTGCQHCVIHVDPAG